MPNTFRTHTCNELTASSVGHEVTLSGWINNRRDHGGVLFIDLRDHYGITQVVIYPDNPHQYEIGHLQKETVVQFSGEVAARSDDNVNPDMHTGEIEVVVKTYEVLGECAPLPFPVFPEKETPEDQRLRYRYLDLRRESVHSNIVLRSRVISHLRDQMTKEGFMEIQTPILTGSSPEGARDYLVPSRVHPGTFYALPQAPQQYKQLLMASGFDKYFQIAPCFRDEDARADRSPGEFYQLDMEMAFADQEDVFGVMERVLSDTFATFGKHKADTAPFTRIPYREAMLKYGTDKPDLRNPIIIRDTSDIFAESGFKAFATAVQNGAVVRAIPVKNIAQKPRSFFDKLVKHAQDSLGSKGLAYLTWKEEEIKGPILKFLDTETVNAIESACDVETGDVVFFVCDEVDVAADIAGKLRTKLGEDLSLLEEGVYRFCWIVDFPMYESNKETKAIEFSHNPFSMPQGGMKALEEQDPLDILAYQYDIVCNGVELSSGAIRNHQPRIMYKAFEIAGYGPEVVEQEFGGMLKAFTYGAPPHGGIAPGVDRMVMLLAGEENIREVIAFPMNQRAEDLLMQAPAPVSEEQLHELHLRHVLPEVQE
ncbi:aspartate--tRNA ligase [Chitinivibrio alkaliphilus]|uniref:Aspartate--tRNA(Asp/Asn) ligase n=1 Tax=Chitinivibrio alkaliphilus ACht1 TaxID=1313304 RepID=U7D710_9BACT|nr:aspartate--tRNA ligase [Chitinivibrio alkaliphilus]ERP31733.1 aspartyl-tRNA synthetase [Chitinivibrio alkaliphilus ACht1]